MELLGRCHESLRRVRGIKLLHRLNPPSLCPAPLQTSHPREIVGSDRCQDRSQCAKGLYCTRLALGTGVISRGTESLLTLRWRRQSRANPSLFRCSLLTGKNTGNCRACCWISPLILSKKRAFSRYCRSNSLKERTGKAQRLIRELNRSLQPDQGTSSLRAGLGRRALMGRGGSA